MAKATKPPSDPVGAAPQAGAINPELEPGDDLGVFDPATDAGTPPREPYTIPELKAFRDNPTKETHLAAAKLLHRMGPLCLDGIVYVLRNGRVVEQVPVRNPHVVTPDDPNEEV